MSDARVERLAGVERKHGGYVSGGVGNGWRCWCGADLRDWWPEGGVTPRDTALDYALRAHRTAELLPVVEQEIAAARAEAWDEGAYAAGYDTCSPEDNPYRIARTATSPEEER